MPDKLSPDAQRILLDPNSDRNRMVRVLCALNGGLSPQRRERLEGLQCHVRSMAGDVFTADVPASALEAVAGLDFIRYVELSRPLRHEQQSNPQ